VEWGSGIKLRSSNFVTRTSPLGQKETSRHVGGVLYLNDGRELLLFLQSMSVVPQGAV
jgi:hypothetical protein